MKARTIEKMILKQKTEKSKAMNEKHIAEYRQKVREMGIINFCLSLPCPPFSKDEEGNTPEFIILEPFQEAFLTEAVDLLRGLLTAGRGAGKTFIIALLILFELITEDYYTINVIGGSINQTQLMQDYIDFFRDNVPEIGYILPRSLYGLKPRITSRYHSRCVFLATSLTASRGPRANRLIVDEFCSGEAKSKVGQKSLKASMFQVMGRKDAKILLTSTSDYVRGHFYEILTTPKKFGFKIFRWSTARHISGKEGRYVYADKNPEHWFSNCWWIDTEQIRQQRMNSSNSEWMVEVLGGISMASGFVYNIHDLNWAECKQCDDCYPYKWGHCKLIEQFNLGDEENTIQDVWERKAGFDYGTNAPCALVIVGRKGKLVFVLFSDEVKGMRTGELVGWVTEHMMKLRVFDFLPDPSSPSEAFSQEIEEAGFNRIWMDNNLKYERIETTKNLFEKHLVIIPKAFWRLMKSLRVVAYDKSSKVVKHDDHSFDAFCYACNDYGRRSPDLAKDLKGVRFPWDEKK